MSEAYHIYMKKESDVNYIDVESQYPGLLYGKCTGLNDKGKRKNIYFESYPEEKGSRVHIGSQVNREPTDINLTLLFHGTVAQRQAAYEGFCTFVENDKILFYDSVRLRKVLLVLNEPVKPSSEVFLGSDPYTEVTFKFKNLWGESKNYNE